MMERGEFLGEITKLFKDTNIKVELLTGKMKVSEKGVAYYTKMLLV